MSCLAAPAPPIPTLPTGFGLGATTPSISFDPTLCCKVLPFPIAIPPIPLAVGVQIPAAILAAIAEAEAVLLAYIDALHVDCPLE